jgi:hypothetical protein
LPDEAGVPIIPISAGEVEAAGAVSLEDEVKLGTFDARGDGKDVELPIIGGRL